MHQKVDEMGKKNIETILMCHCPLTYAMRVPLLPLSHHKNHCSMIVDNVGFKIGLLETSSFVVAPAFYFFPWCKPKWSRD